MENIKTLDDLINSDEYQNTRFGSTSDDWINDSERMERVNAAAEFGCDGSTHSEHIDDWRECLSRLDLDETTAAAIEKEIDACEQWHEKNGSLYQECG